MCRQKGSTIFVVTNIFASKLYQDSPYAYISREMAILAGQREYNVPVKVEIVTARECEEKPLGIPLE